jgi:hypothetical protein
MTYQPIIVEAEGENLHTYTTEVQEEASREDAVLGCWICDIPLTLDSFNTECAGSKKVDGDLDTEQSPRI